MMPQSLPPGAAWLLNNWEELRSYNFRWVASVGEGVLASNPDLGELMDLISARGLAEQTVYALVDFEEDVEEGGFRQEAMD